MSQSVNEGLQDVYLSEPRRDSMQRQLMHFDIMHPQHGKIGTLSGGRTRVGGERIRHEMEPGVEYARVPRSTTRGAKTSFMITGVGVDGDAVARIHGIKDYDQHNPYKNPEAHRRVRELTPHVLGPATVRELGRQLRKKTRVTMVSGNTRISGVRKKVGKTSFQDVSPLPFREGLEEALFGRINDLAWKGRGGFMAGGDKTINAEHQVARAWLHPDGTVEPVQKVSHEHHLVKTRGIGCDKHVKAEKLKPFTLCDDCTKIAVNRGHIRKVFKDAYVTDGSPEQANRVIKHVNTHHPELKYTGKKSVQIVDANTETSREHQLTYGESVADVLILQKLLETRRPLDLEHVAAHAEGRHFETGRPVEFRYVRNTEKAPNFGSRFGQDIEPHGRYMVHNENPGDQPHGWETGTHRFENPLVIRWGTTTGEEHGWKRKLSNAFGGKKGKALSTALQRHGHDGIVTVDHHHGTPDVREIVALGVPR